VLDGLGLVVQVDLGVDEVGLALEVALDGEQLIDTGTAVAGRAVRRGGDDERRGLAGGNRLAQRDLVHVDFHAVSATEKITSAVPIETTGEALGVRTFGGLLEHSLRTLEVQCYPQDLPGIVQIDVTNLNIGETLHVRDLQLPAGVEAITDEDLTVVSVVASRVGEETTETAEQAATPEVITEKKTEAKVEGAQS